MTATRPPGAGVGAPPDGFCGLIGRHPRMLALHEQIRRAAEQRLPVLIEGETGTGKELVARAIHHLGGAARPFVPLNVAALPEQLADSELFGTTRGAFTGAVDHPGLIESAHGGTLYLDEASELAPGTQARLLRTLELGTLRRIGARVERHVSVRPILSIQHSARDLVQCGRWRRDFRYRVDGTTLQVPPLRDRSADVLLLVNHALQRLDRPPITEESLGAFRTYQWPGNVRELLHAVERAVGMAGRSELSTRILEEALQLEAPDVGPVEKPLVEVVREAERRHIERALRQARYEKQRAALLLGISIHQLYRRLATHGIPSRQPDRFRDFRENRFAEIAKAPPPGSSENP